MDHTRPDLDRLKAELSRRRAVTDQAVADYLSNNRARFTRLRATEDPPPDERPADDENYDDQESWLVSGYGSAAEPGSGGAPATSAAHGNALSRIERGELSWHDVFSGRTTDPDARELHGFLTERIAEAERMGVRRRLGKG
jgi:hypothetical protein